MSKYGIWFLLVMCNLFWAGNYVFGKYVIVEVTPLWITFSRWVLALFFLIPIAHYIEKPVWSKAKKDWFLLLCMGVLGVIGFNIFLYSALRYTTPTNAALVSALNPGVIVICSIILYKERISVLRALGLIISFAGALVVSSATNQMQPCIDACQKCYQACYECFNACLNELDLNARKNCVSMLVECAMMCQMSVSMMSMSGKFSKEHCALCAKICDNVHRNVLCLKTTTAKNVRKYAVCAQMNVERWLRCNDKFRQRLWGLIPRVFFSFSQKYIPLLVSCG